MKNINIKKNTIANYIGQFYIMAIGIIITPFYLRYMGTEAYGLVGFYALLQVWFNMLDMGLSPAFGREVARLRGDSTEFSKLSNILRVIEFYFFVLFIITISIFFIFDDFIVNKWMNVEDLSYEIVSYSLIMMGLIISVRWFSTLYRSGINSMEDQLWLNAVNITLVSFKFIGSLLLLIFITNDIRHFFEYQLLIYILEMFIFMYRFYKVSFNNTQFSLFSINIRMIIRILPFAFGIAYSTVLWTFIRQFDKLLLSNILSLNDFAYLSLVILLTNAITALATPVFLAVVPRMTLYFGNGDTNRVLSMYLDMSQIITWITISTVTIISIFSKEIIYILTGDIDAAIWCANIMPWYMMGSGIIVMGTFPYYLQNIFGNLKIYVRASTIAFIIQVPLTYFVTKYYGVFGAAKLWLIFSLLWFFILTTVVHNKLIPGFNKKWLVNLMYVIISISLVSYLIYYNVNLNLDDSKIELSIKIIFISLILFIVSSLSVSRVRNMIINRFRYIKGNK